MINGSSVEKQWPYCFNKERKKDKFLYRFKYRIITVLVHLHQIAVIFLSISYLWYPVKTIRTVSHEYILSNTYLTLCRHRTYLPSDVLTCVKWNFLRCCTNGSTKPSCNHSIKDLFIWDIVIGLFIYCKYVKTTHGCINHTPIAILHHPDS